MSAVARRLCAVAAGCANSSSDEAPPPGASMPIRRLMPRSSQRPTPFRIPPPPPPATLMPFACLAAVSGLMFDRVQAGAALGHALAASVTRELPCRTRYATVCQRCDGQLFRSKRASGTRQLVAAAGLHFAAAHLGVRLQPASEVGRLGAGDQQPRVQPRQRPDAGLVAQNETGSFMSMPFL